MYVCMHDELLLQGRQVGNAKTLHPTAIDFTVHGSATT